MRLIDLAPRWVNRDGGFSNDPALGGVGLYTDKCPCGCDIGLLIYFANPLDGGLSVDKGWRRFGDTFETLTLEPSIQRIPPYPPCGWHGWIRNGEIVNA